MSRGSVVVALACVALMAVGCEDGRDEDDAGGIVLMDSGPGSDAGPGGGTDAGGDSCPPASASMPSMPMACEAATLTCLMGAADAMAQQACIDADPNAMNCGACITQDLFYTCSNPMGGGCDEEYGEIQCCLMTACPSGDATCVNMATGMGGACATQAQAFFTCANSAQMAMRCGITNTCFMSMMFLPDFEQRPPVTRHAELELFRAWLVDHFASSY